MDFILLLIVVFSASFSVFYSFKSRGFLKAGKDDAYKFYSAKMNIAMGTMLISMASIQLFTFGADVTGWRVGIGIFFLVLGGFNLYMGIKNYKIFGQKLMQ